MLLLRNVLGLFEQEVSRMNLSRSSPVAVALSGGSDSLALLWMAKQVFSNLVGLTVDHRLREESTEESNRAGALAAKLGVEHHVLSVDWEGAMPTGYKIQSTARQKRYDTMMEFCSQHNIPTLMTAHHLDDQIETMVYRMSWGSSVDGMAGMYALSRLRPYDHVQLARPLLTVRKEQLHAVCEEAGLEWVEDKTNTSPRFCRNFIRLHLKEDPELTTGLLHLHETLSSMRGELIKRVDEVVRKVAVVNSGYGFLEVDSQALLQHSRPVVRRVISALLKYISGDPWPVPYRALNRVVAGLPNLTNTSYKVLHAHNCFLFPLESGRVGISGAGFPWRQATPKPLKVGEPVLWDNRWEIRLDSQTDTGNLNEKFFVRNIGGDTDLACVGGARAVRALRREPLPPVRARTALPVIVDRKGKVVTIPHIKYLDRTYGIVAHVMYRPLLSMDVIINKTKTSHHCL